MLTPEIQQYINQQRSAGVSDTQIRQMLAARGWQQTDLDQAFGVISNAPQTQAKAPMPGWAKALIIVLILLFLLPNLIWVGILGYGYYKIKHGGIGITNSGTTPINSKEPSNCNDHKLTLLDTLSPNLPQTWPSDIPVYPGSKLLGSGSLTPGVGTSSFVQAAYCSKDSVEQIAAYYIDNRSGWVFTKNISQTQSNTQINSSNQFLVGEKSGPSGVWVDISKTGNEADTLITITVINSFKTP